MGKRAAASTLPSRASAVSWCADVCHWCYRRARWWRRPPPHQDKLAPGIGVADHRGRVVGKYARRWRQIADVAVDDAEQRVMIAAWFVVIE
jgi:hypothetical protein